MTDETFTTLNIASLPNSQIGSVAGLIAADACDLAGRTASPEIREVCLLIERMAIVQHWELLKGMLR